MSMSMSISKSKSSKSSKQKHNSQVGERGDTNGGVPVWYERWNPRATVGDYVKNGGKKSKIIYIAMNGGVGSAVNNSSEKVTMHYAMANRLYYLFKCDNCGVDYARDFKCCNNHSIPSTCSYCFEGLNFKDFMLINVDDNKICYVDPPKLVFTYDWGKSQYEPAAWFHKFPQVQPYAAYGLVNGDPKNQKRGLNQISFAEASIRGHCYECNCCRQVKCRESICCNSQYSRAPPATCYGCEGNSLSDDGQNEVLVDYDHDLGFENVPDQFKCDVYVQKPPEVSFGKSKNVDEMNCTQKLLNTAMKMIDDKDEKIKQLEEQIAQLKAEVEVAKNVGWNDRHAVCQAQCSQTFIDSFNQGYCQGRTQGWNECGYDPSCESFYIAPNGDQ